MTDDVLVLICLRNEFYKNQYRLLLGVCLLGLCVIAALVGMLVYVVKHPTQPLYFVTDKAGRFIQDIPVQQPNMSDKDLTAWVIEGVEAAYTFDFVNFHSQLQDAQRYFTDYGWRNYMKGLAASNNLIAMKERRLIATAKVVSPPQIVGEGGLGRAAVYSWKYVMPVLVTYLYPPYDDQSKFENPLQVTVLVQRQGILSSYNGVGIVQLIGVPATTAPAQGAAGPT